MSELSLIGKKIGMSREFYKSGQSVPVTILKMETGRIIHIIDKDQRGYNAVQVGFGKIKSSKLNKSQKGYFSKKNTEPKKVLKEFRVKDLEQYKEGNELGYRGRKFMKNHNGEDIVILVGDSQVETSHPFNLMPEKTFAASTTSCSV